jgi:hypothetical protein
LFLEVSYRIYDESEIIYFLNIVGHDLDSNKKSTKLQSEIDGSNKLGL